MFESVEAMLGRAQQMVGVREVWASRLCYDVSECRKDDCSNVCPPSAYLLAVGMVWR